MPGHGWRWRRRGRRGRPMKPRTVRTVLPASRFVPVSTGLRPLTKEPIVMTPDEVEALRLVDYEGLLQQEASEHMGVSRGTVWRCLHSARRKMGMMLVEGRELIISTGELRGYDRVPR